MKLILAIISTDDTKACISALNKASFHVTRLATTGGFLRAGNTTLLVGFDDEKLKAVMDIIEHVCKSRKQMATAPTSMPGMTGMYSSGSYPVEVTVGGATVFVLSVDQFVKL